MTGAAPSLRFGTAEQLAVLVDMEDAVRAEIALHLERRKLWFPNDLLPADATLDAAADAEIKAMREAARGIPDVARVGLALNLLTEEGLPHFHRLIAVHFGAESPWRDWNYMWTAEEDRHGCALRDYVRDARLFDMRALEAAQYRYIEAGFDPEWQQDPYRLLAYTSLQEKATQVSHANTGRLCAGIEPAAQRVAALRVLPRQFSRDSQARPQPGPAVAAQRHPQLRHAGPRHAGLRRNERSRRAGRHLRRPRVQPHRR